MSRRSGPAFVALGLLLLALGGCGHEGNVSGDDRIRAAVQGLGGDPDHVYEQDVLVKTMQGEGYETKKIVLVPSKAGKTFQIVDELGDVYADYEDLVLNNRLTP